MVYIILVFSTLFEILLLVNFLSVFAEKKNQTFRTFFGVLIPNLGINIQYFFPISLTQVSALNGTSFVLFILFVSFSFSLKPMGRIFLVSLYLLFTLLSEILSAAILTVFFSNLYHEKVLLYGFLLTAALKICFLSLTKIIYKKHRFHMFTFPKWIILSAPITSVILLFLYLFFNYVIILEDSLFWFSWIFALQIILLNIVIFAIYIRLRIGHRNELEQKELQFNLDKQKEKLEEVILSQQKIKTMRHDLKNTVLILKSYLESDDREQALSYISAIQKEIQLVEKIMLKSYTPNKELNYLIVHKVEYAKYYSVNTEINCFCPEKFDISNDFIIAVIGNLFDNAIDACKLLPINIPKHIKVKIKYYNRSLFIDIKNTVPENFEINDLIEGTGIKSMKKMIEENNGIYRRFSHGKEFCVQVVIWF